MSSSSTQLSITNQIELNDKSFLEYLNKINVDLLTNSILSELRVREGYQNYFRDLYNKTKNFILKEKEKFYDQKINCFFNDKPHFNITLVHSYLIIAGAPFVEASKQDKFREYLTKKSILVEFVSVVKEIIFPYSDSDKPNLENNSIIILKFGSAEEANIVKQSINGKFIMKNNQVFVLSIPEFIQLGNDKKEELLRKLNNVKSSIENYYSWEDENLKEFYIHRSQKSLSYKNFHYFKKEPNSLSNLSNLSSSENTSWSPQGTYFIRQTSSELIFYSGSNNLNELFRISDSNQKFIISNNEKFLVTFVGLGQTNLISNSSYIREIVTRHNVIIWNLVTKTVIKTLKISNDECFDNFKWSEDSKYLSRLKGDVLIVYEAPDFKMLYDEKVQKRHPLVDKVSSYFWFSKNDYLMTISENRKNKQLESNIVFYKVESRRQCITSIPLKNTEVKEVKWHPNEKTLLLFLKKVNTPEWSIKIVDFDYGLFTFKTKFYEIIKPVLRNTQQESLSEKDIDFKSAEIHWLNYGNEVLIIGRKRLLIPIYSEYERKYINSDEGRSISLFLYSFNNKDLSMIELSRKEELKYNEVEVSPNGKNLILYNKISDCRNIFGDGLLLVINKGEIINITKMSFTEKFKRLSFDQSGRYFCVELNRIISEKSVGFRIYFVSGELILEEKDDALIEFIWRPRRKILFSYDEICKMIGNSSTEEKLFKEFEIEDNEFLSEHEKEKRKIYNEQYNKVYNVINRRRKIWKDNESIRKKIYDEQSNEVFEYYVYVEDVIKSEEKAAQ